MVKPAQLLGSVQSRDDVLQDGVWDSTDTASFAHQQRDSIAGPTLPGH